MTAQSRAAEVVFSEEAKHRLHLSLISSSFGRRFPFFLSLMYCALPTFLPCNLHSPLRCPYQPLMSPALVNSSSLPEYTSRCLSFATCMTPLSFLHAVRTSCLSVQAFTNSARIAVSSNQPDRRVCRIWPGITSSADRRSVSVKNIPFSPTVPEFGLRELTVYKLYQPFVSVDIRRGCSSVVTFAPCGSLLFSITNLPGSRIVAHTMLWSE